MNRVFDWIEKYKFGLIATVAGYIFIFSYLQMSSFTRYYPIDPFVDGPEIIADEEILLEQDQIEVPQDFGGEYKNITRDRNDQRERGDKDWSENPPMDGEAYAKALEQTYKDETGGEAKRAEIREQYEEFKKQEEIRKKKEAAEKAKGNKGDGGTNTQYSGNVLVESDVPGRNPSRLPIPGYMCGKGASGTIVMNVVVNKSGNVVSAKFNSGASSSSNYCMIENAQKYAMKSRYNYDGSAPNSQSGKIYYTFISQ